MYYVSKLIEIAFAHKLTLDYESKCTKLHGHNAIVTVFCCSGQLNSNGMVVDFKHIKETVTSQLDHGYANELISLNPTAENIAFWIVSQIPKCYKAVVQESEGNVAIYEKD